MFASNHANNASNGIWNYVLIYEPSNILIDRTYISTSNQISIRLNIHSIGCMGQI